MDFMMKYTAIIARKPGNSDSVLAKVISPLRAPKAHTAHRIGNHQHKGWMR